MIHRPPTRRRSSRPHIERSRPAPPTRIGVGVNGHGSGRDAVALASQFARATGAELLLIFAYEEPLLEPVVPTELGWASARRQARGTLTETRDSLAPGARVVFESNPLVSRALCQVARREHRDLLVVGSGHKAMRGQVSLGHRMRELIGQLECPLAIAPRGLRNRVKDRLERIGVGFDDGRQARAALRFAAAIARAAGATLEVRGALDDLGSEGLAAGEIEIAGEPIVVGQRRSLLDRARAEAQETGVPAHVEVGPGAPADVLSALGDKVDLLVIGSGRFGPDGCVDLGETGRGLAGAAPCPVLITPKVRDAASV